MDAISPFEMEADSPSRRLFSLAAALALSGSHRGAAVVYSTVANASSGSSPLEQASALYHSAFQLMRASRVNPDHPQVEQDLQNAANFLQKSVFIFRAQPGAAPFFQSLNVYILLEALHTYRGDRSSSKKTTSQALITIGRHADFFSQAYPFWVHFKSRELAQTFISADSAAETATSAKSISLLCAHHGAHADAAAFRLCAAHATLAYPHLFPDEEPIQHLQASAELLQLAGTDVSAGTSLHTAYDVLSALALSRTGRRAQPPSLRMDGTANHSGSEVWTWQSEAIARALALHARACALRGDGDGRAAWSAANAALSEADGAPRGTLPDALGIALLESAARIRLVRVEFPESSQLVGAALRIAQSTNVDRRARCATYLLAAEYYALSGRYEFAQQSTRYLKAIEREGAEGNAADIGDVFHMALSYKSLLTGDARSVQDIDDDSNSGSSAWFRNCAVKAVAALAEGVHSFRMSRVIDAREAYERGLAHMGGGQNAPNNDQVVANLLVALSGLFLTHENIQDAPRKMTLNALNLANRNADVVTQVKANRQFFKVTRNMNQRTNGAYQAELQRALQMLKAAMANLAHRQDVVFAPLESE